VAIDTALHQSAFTHLLSPLGIAHPGGQLTLRNRVLVSAHVPGFAEDNKPGQRYIDYHKRYAAEGVGLQITGGTPVHKSGLLSLASDGLWNVDDSIIPGYQRLGEAVHAEGGRILAQLAHSGGTVKLDLPGTAAWSASSIRSSITGQVSHAMTRNNIEEITRAYAAAAVRVRKGGLDGVEILSAFGFLPQAFLSPLTNQRDDDYGGCLENRMRFLIEVLKAVRGELGTTQILGVRLPGDEFEPAGLTLEDMTQVCKVLSEHRLVDYLNIIAHTNFSHGGRAKHWAPTPAPHGIFVELAATIKRSVSLPVFTVGRIIDPMHAEQILARGQADMVGMTRAHICDPSIVRKISNQQHRQIRPCVGANTCIANRYAGKPIRCMHNPELIAPGASLQPATQVNRVAVIGAGPAGLEAARLCALRGHQVVVYEKATRVGGQLAYWAMSKSMQELGRITDWRIAELNRLGVEIQLEKQIHAEDLPKLATEHIILATGAIDLSRNLPGEFSSKVLSPIQLLMHTSFKAERALVINDGRGQAGLVCAERLQEHGVQVEVITEDIAVAHDLDPTNRHAWYERLLSKGAVFTPQTAVETLQGSKVTLRHLFSQQISQRNEVDLLIDWNGSVARDSLLSNGNAQDLVANVHAIGDCVASRGVELAMAEALKVARSI